MPDSQVPTVLGLVVRNCQWGTNNRHVETPNSRAASDPPSPTPPPSTACLRVSLASSAQCSGQRLCVFDAFNGSLRSSRADGCWSFRWRLISSSGLGWAPAEDLTVICAASCVLTSLKGCGTWVVAAAGGPYLCASHCDQAWHQRDFRHWHVGTPDASGPRNCDPLLAGHNSSNTMTACNAEYLRPARPASTLNVWTSLCLMKTHALLGRLLRTLDPLPKNLSLRALGWRVYPRTDTT